MRYDVAGVVQTQRSNEATLIVAERLDLQLARQGQGAVTVRTDPTPVPFMLTNADNGEEAFDVAASINAGSVSMRGIAMDTDGDGRYDPARDTMMGDGVTPVLAPGQTLMLFAILSATDPQASINAMLAVTAHAATGSGRTGSAYAGMGDGGGDAVVGPTGAAATLSVPLQSSLSGPSLSKSQSVRAVDGSASAVRDAVITYTLEARFVGALPTARIDDRVPAGTRYVPGSLTLDGVALSDAADGDAGAFDGAAISVALAGVAANSVRTIQFKTKIQ